MKKRKYSFPDLVRLMTRLRGPRGCPWDQKQTHKSLLRYLREESAEVAAAVRAEDYDNLREELGDLLLQVLFHAELAREKKRFDMEDVVQELSEKLVRRHPHVFGKKKLKTAEEVSVQWKILKAQEKKKKKRSSA